MYPTAQRGILFNRIFFSEPGEKLAVWIFVRQGRFFEVSGAFA